MEVDDLIEEIEEIGDESDESDEDHVLSADSDRISDYSDDLTEIIRKVVTNSQLNALNGGTKYCAIYFYGWCFGSVRVMYDRFGRCRIRRNVPHTKTCN